MLGDVIQRDDDSTPWEDELGKDVEELDSEVRTHWMAGKIQDEVEEAGRINVDGNDLFFVPTHGKNNGFERRGVG